MQPYYLWPGAFGAVAQIAAYNESEEWLEELKEYLRGNAQFIADFIQERMPKVKYRYSGSNVSWLAGFQGLWNDRSGIMGFYVP